MKSPMKKFNQRYTLVSISVSKPLPQHLLKVCRGQWNWTWATSQVNRLPGLKSFIVCLHLIALWYLPFIIKVWYQHDWGSNAIWPLVKGMVRPEHHIWESFGRIHETSVKSSGVNNSLWTQMMVGTKMYHIYSLKSTEKFDFMIGAIVIGIMLCFCKYEMIGTSYGMAG